jgi:hypothetical protein
MREYLFHGKRVDNGEWVEGYLGYNNTRKQYYIMDDVNTFPIPVYEESVGQYTEMNEFVVSDRSYNKPLFEGDIVEVWGWRSPRYTYDAKSQYDGKIKVRATICFKHGEWTLDYTNKYNQSLAKLKGKEVDDREVTGEWNLYRYQGHNGNEDWYREHNAHYKWSDIVKIGNIFDNVDLLEG